MKRADAERAAILSRALNDIRALPARLAQPPGSYDFVGLDLTAGPRDWNGDGEGISAVVDAETGRILLELARNLIVDQLKALGVETVSPGPVSDSSTGPPDDAPYVPSWCYPRGAKICPCGHHEGYHAGPGSRCLHAVQFTRCGCPGLPVACHTTDEERYGGER